MHNHTVLSLVSHLDPEDDSRVAWELEELIFTAKRTHCAPNSHPEDAVLPDDVARSILAHIEAYKRGIDELRILEAVRSDIQKMEQAAVLRKMQGMPRSATL